MTNPSFHVAALYQFTRFEKPEALREPLYKLCEEQGIKGTLLLAHEGINGTIAGSQSALDIILAHIRTLPGCAQLDVKFSYADTMPFLRLKVRLKKEIVTLGAGDIDPLKNAGEYVAAENWNALIDDPETIVIDTRNDYEVKIGTFKGAINPKTESFHELPQWVKDNEAMLQGKKIAMFCTGGIRCEKSTAYLKAQGFDKVYHLKGGILKYLEVVSSDQSRWQGECFVFDQRVSVGHALELGDHCLCFACRTPLTQEDQQSSFYEAGVKCPHCVEGRTTKQRERYRTRQQQMQIAKQKGIKHLGEKQK